jgi:hypothetical protein
MCTPLPQKKKKIIIVCSQPIGFRVKVPGRKAAQLYYPRKTITFSVTEAKMRRQPSGVWLATVLQCLLLVLLLCVAFGSSSPSSPAPGPATPHRAAESEPLARRFGPALQIAGRKRNDQRELAPES